MNNKYNVYTFEEVTVITTTNKPTLVAFISRDNSLASTSVTMVADNIGIVEAVDILNKASLPSR